VDLAQLARVREDVGEETLRRYAAVFLDLLEDRLDRLARAAVGKTADAQVAAFDLQVSSVMLGAGRLAELAGEVEASLRSGVPVPVWRMRMLRAEAASVSIDLPRALDALADADPGDDDDTDADGA
jgi:hypothetical protein